MPKKDDDKFLSLKIKIFLILGMSMCVSFFVTTFIFIRREINNTWEDLHARSALVGEVLFTSAAPNIIHEDLSALDSLRKRIEAEHKDMVFLQIWNRDADMLTHSDGDIHDADNKNRVLYSLQQGKSTWRQIQHRGRTVGVMYHPMNVGSHTYAVVCMGFSLEPLHRRIRSMMRWVALVIASTLAFVAIVMGLVSGFMFIPIKELSDSTLEVADGNLDVHVAVRSHDEIGILTKNFNDMTAGLRERDFVKETFGRYMTKQVADSILSNPDAVALGGKKQEVTILFSDIRGFTSFSESHAPEQVVSHLNEYMSAMVDVIIKYEGVVDKFIGDAIMAVFGSPIAREDDPLRAVKTALEMQQRLTALNEKWEQQGKDTFKIGIGVNTGEVIVGNIGDVRRMEYTVIGDNVNIASRIEGLTKNYNCPIIISESTYQKVRDHVQVNQLESVVVKGKSRSVAIYELIDVREQGPENPGALQ